MNAEWTSIVAIGISALALLISAATYVNNRAQRRAGERQAAASEAQVEVLKRQLNVMITQGQAGDPAIPYVPPWSIRKISNARYALTNGGVSKEFGVFIDFPKAEGGIVRTSTWDHIDPGASQEFMVLRTLQSNPRSVVVRWRRDEDRAAQYEEWTTDLP